MSIDPHLVALLGLPKLGPKRLDRLIGAFGDAEAAWRAVRGGRLDGVPLNANGDNRADLLRNWQVAAAAVDVRDLATAHARAGVRILGPEDPTWPDAFTIDPEPPRVLFVRGDPELLSLPAVAIVGTRRCTAAGAATARELGHDLAAAGVGVVSGLALGIDGAAHRGCLEGGGAPVGVVATGLDIVYPRKHARLWEQVGSAGVLVSEAPLGRGGERWRFPARNRLIAALALVVVVVESRRRGGSMHTVDAAAERDTEVMAVPGSVRSGPSEGPNQLLVDGCAVARDATDVLVALGTRAPSDGQLRLEAPERSARDVGEDPADDAVACAVSCVPSSLDAIVAAAGLPFTEVAARLASLELSGLVERVPDGYQRRIP